MNSRWENPSIGIYACRADGERWLQRFRGQPPLFALLLGFTDTGLIPGISAAGATPADRQLTALADAEFLYHGPDVTPRFSLPPLQAGASPAIISRAVLSQQQIPTWLFDAGLPQSLPVPSVDLGGQPAACLTLGEALPKPVVHHLWQQGLAWGEHLMRSVRCRYLIIGECVVGGTTTALALLLGLGIAAEGRVNSSHPICNHAQKRLVAIAGLNRWQLQRSDDPLDLVAAIGDPMQPVAAGMAMAASRWGGVLLAGGTQMLAVYALMQAIHATYDCPWQPESVSVGTTRWVAEDASGDTGGLATQIGAPLLATQLSFAKSRYWQLRAYEEGFVKEGVGAGGCAIAAHLYKGWQNSQLLTAIEQTFDSYARQKSPAGHH